MATLAFLELSTLHDLDCLRGLVATALGHVLDLVDNVIALEHFAEHDVATIEPSGTGTVSILSTVLWIPGRNSRGNSGGDEELRAVGVLAGVGHAQQSLAGVPYLEVLIGKLVAVDRLATSAISTGKVTTLDHKVLDHTVERRALISKALLAGSKSPETLLVSLSPYTHNISIDFIPEVLCSLYKIPHSKSVVMI